MTIYPRYSSSLENLVPEQLLLFVTLSFSFLSLFFTQTIYLPFYVKLFHFFFFISHNFKSLEANYYQFIYTNLFFLLLIYIYKSYMLTTKLTIIPFVNTYHFVIFTICFSTNQHQIYI